MLARPIHQRFHVILTKSEPDDIDTMDIYRYRIVDLEEDRMVGGHAYYRKSDAQREAAYLEFDRATPEFLKVAIRTSAYETGKRDDNQLHIVRVPCINARTYNRLFRILQALPTNVIGHGMPGVALFTGDTGDANPLGTGQQWAIELVTEEAK
jgi:hypothetical protein